LHYLGAHGSDSGLTALLRSSPYTDPSTGDHLSIEPVDWPEFVLSTLDTQEGDGEALEEYGVYVFFGRIPDKSSEAAVFGLPSAEDPALYDGIVIRTIDAVVGGEDAKTPEGLD